jgi:hypothetical protein
MGVNNGKKMDINTSRLLREIEDESHRPCTVYVDLITFAFIITMIITSNLQIRALFVPIIIAIYIGLFTFYKLFNFVLDKLSRNNKKDSKLENT